MPAENSKHVRHQVRVDGGKGTTRLRRLYHPIQFVVALDAALFTGFNFFNNLFEWVNPKASAPDLPLFINAALTHPHLQSIGIFNTTGMVFKISSVGGVVYYFHNYVVGELAAEGCVHLGLRYFA